MPSTPSHCLPKMGGSSTLADCRALVRAHQASSVSRMPLADWYTLHWGTLSYSIYQLPVSPGSKEWPDEGNAALTAAVSALQL
jgi:hypothetical protein